MTPNDVKIVADNIDDFIEIPGGVIELRKTLLTLAVSGLLVPQKHTEHNSLPKDIIDGEPLYSIPSTWRWVRLDSISDIEYGTRIVKGRNISGTYYVYGGGGKTFTTNTFNRSDSVIISRFGMSPYCVRKIHGKFFLNDSGLTVSTKDQNTLFQAYLDYVFFAFEQQIYSFGRGAAQKNLYVDDFRKMPIPVPPISEQKRIVIELEKVLPLIPELETKKQERDEIRARLARSAMQALGKGESKIAFEQLTELVKTPSDIKELENALLTLAVSGKLVPQSKTDGAAEDLYNQIQKERIKAEENSTARRRKAKGLTQITDDEIPFEVPASWKWVRLGDCMSISSGDSLSVKDAKEGKYLVYGGNGIAGRHSAFNTKKGTIVIGRVGALCGIAHIVESDAWVTDNAFIVDYPVKLIDREYFALVLNYLNLRSTHRGSAQPVISGISVYPTPMPLAPLAEQKRIVKKVEEVMVLINRLKQVVGVK